MKVFLIAVLLAGLLVPAAWADPLPGFRESVRLSPRASAIVGQPVRVYCTGDRELWADYSINDGGTALDRGIAFFDRAEMYLAPWVCQPLERWVRGKTVLLPAFAAGLTTLIHESVHLRGVHDEAAADCGAVREAARWARELFGVKRAVTLRQVVIYVRADVASRKSACAAFSTR